MRSIMALVLALGSVAVVGCAPPRESHPVAEKAAIRAAEAWLALMDTGDYEQTWEQAAEYLKTMATKDEWLQRLSAVRKIMGKKISRTIRSQQYTTSFPGAPDGEYVVIRYDTVFENKKAAVETVTPMVGTDGKWHVSGYFIR